MIKTKIQRKKSFTPLRYPGGKTSLFEFFADVIERHGWERMSYIEPYAGGAGAALSLLLLGKVERITINDFDPAIFAFWKSITENSDEFIKLVEETPTTVAEWEKQKLVYKTSDKSDVLTLGFATFFLNRTNRSGILNGGPIGGKAQSGEWKIDARYNKKSLIEKLKLISLYKDKITVLNEDGVTVINKYVDDPTSFFYIDPPYFVKGANLYMNAFKLADHQKLAAVLKEQSKAKWLLSYDNEEAILELYPNFAYETFSLRYSAHHNTKSGSELMIFSDAIDSSLF